MVKSTGEVLSALKMSIYDMVTGPSHFDFPLKQKGKQKENLGRLIFDVKISQKLKFGISTRSVSFEMKESLKKQLYNFNLKLKDGVMFYDSEHSSDFVNPLYKDSSEDSSIFLSQSFPDMSKWDQVHSLFGNSNSNVQSKRKKQGKEQ